MKRFISFIFIVSQIFINAYADWDETYEETINLFDQGEINKAINTMMPYANSGNDVAQNIVGYFFLEQGEIAKARLWFDKAVIQGNVEAMFNAGLTYDGINNTGLGSQFVNLSKAKDYYLKAASAPGDSECKYKSLVNCCIIMHKNDKQTEEAITLLQAKLRETEHAGLRRILADFYTITGKPWQAVKMYRAAAEYGDMDAMYEMGMINMNPDHLKGANVSRDTKEALRWFTKIAEINNPDYKDFWGSRTGRAMRYLTTLHAELYYETFDKKHLEACLKWGCRSNHDMFAEEIMFQLYQEGLSDSKNFSTYEEWTDHLEAKYSLDSDVDGDFKNTGMSRPNTFALIIANEQYEYEPEVPFASRDGNIVFKYLNQLLGIPKENIRLISDASLNKMKYELEWLKDISLAHDGAQNIVYYAGHGMPAEDMSTSYLLPKDGFSRNVSTGLDLNEMLAEISATGTKTTVILDACFSGAKREGDMLVSARGVAIKQPKPQVTGNTIVISACSDKETAYSIDSQQHGLFTYYFLKKLKECEGRVTLGELNDYLYRNIQQQSISLNGKLQTPCISVSPDLADDWRTIIF